MNIHLSEREIFRKDFSNTFLADLISQIGHGSDPRNRIGLSFGFSIPRAYQIWQERTLFKEKI